jgi:hypothetical protein
VSAPQPRHDDPSKEDYLMKRPRVLLLALLVTLLGLASRTHANAVPCYSCLCAEECDNLDQSCIAACKGNTACDATCATEFARCIEDCV